MAKLESLSCPSCGSSDLKKVDETTYHCNHCGTTSIADKQSKEKTVVLVVSKDEARDLLKDGLPDKSPKDASQQKTSPQEPPKRGVPIWAQILVWVALLALLTVMALGLRRSQQGTVQVGDTIPDFTLKFFDGYTYQGKTEVKLSELRGKVVVLNFWASWCKPCEQEAAEMEATWRAYEDSGNVVFVGADYVDTEPEARGYLTKFDITYPNGPDLGTRISQTFRIKGVPETYFIDKNGKLANIQVGPFTSEADIHTIIDPLLNK